MAEAMAVAEAVTVAKAVTIAKPVGKAMAVAGEGGLGRVGLQVVSAGSLHSGGV